MSTGIDADHFKAAMGSFAAGVTIVTTVDASGRPTGLTVSAFSSLSLDPPLCLVCIDKRAGNHDPLTTTRKMAVNVLADGQADVSNTFASRRPDKFEGLDWAPGPALGMPVLGGCLATAECTIVEILPGGDHDIFVGRVDGCTVDPDGKPLVYWRGAYGDVTSRPKAW